VTSNRSVLVAGPSWVGDMVMAQSLFKTLVCGGDSVAVDVVAPTWSAPLLARMPEVRCAIALDAMHGELALRKRASLGRSLRSSGYSQAIVLPRSLKSALVPFFAAIPRRTGFRGEWRYGLINDMRPLDRGVLDQTVKRFVALGIERGGDAEHALPEPKLDVDDDNLDSLMARFSLGRDKPVIGMMPGAEYGSAKRWPVERFTALAARLADAGMQIWLLGSDKERQIGESIRHGSASAEVHNLCGRTALADAVDLLSVARVAVTNDSGLMHVAAAVGAHVIALYGSSSPAFTPPLTASKSIFFESLGCSPCFQRDCPLGHLQCLRAIGVDAVEQAVLAHAAANLSGPKSEKQIRAESCGD
jgi:heptosyltransferase-2